MAIYDKAKPLDLTLLNPSERHHLVFIQFDELEQGESLTVYTDSDPQALFCQFRDERSNSFKWDYQENGPAAWKICITKRILNQRNETLGRLAAKDVRKAGVFKKYGLDFCCGGNRTLEEACAEKGLELYAIEKELDAIDLAPSGHTLQYNDWDIDFLAAYIENAHHAYVKGILPEIVAYALKVAKVHGESHPEMLTISRVTEEINTEMTAHMLKEEKVLFPYIRKLVFAQANHMLVEEPAFICIESPVAGMEAEHEMVGKNLETIRLLSNNYTLPPGACGSYGLLYKMLSEFETNLHIHVHLENNILFPKAIVLEKKDKSRFTRIDW